MAVPQNTTCLRVRLAADEAEKWECVHWDPCWTWGWHPDGHGERGYPALPDCCMGTPQCL